MKAKYINPYTDFGFKKLFGEKVFIKAFETAETANFDEKQLAEYEESLKHYRDLKGVIDTYFEEGEKVGIEKGRKEGREEGEDNKAKEIVQNSLKEGLSIEIISKITGLPVEEIEKLQ
jgi:predicted transposase/invertase (TIGR01784 family)